ncbi:class I SAM-dependent DNA methyltransferase [Candidatus Saccharibacteria bacterium]|nr:class I SAM-dependent DNA methyltransferase [Candidatus Saccharibacteria bacterium]
MPKLTDQEQRQAAKEFYERYKNRGKEKQDDQSFWNDLLHDVLGVERASDYIDYQKEVHFEDSVKFADGYIRKTRILIEQKGNDVDLSKGQKQSDGVYLRPDQQARRYADNMPTDEKPRYIITSNFKEIWVYDENRPHSDPEKILVKDLPKEYYRLQFIVDTGNAHIKKEMELSIKAGEIVGEFYNALHDQYHNPDDPETLKSLNKLCVRLVFCLYAEDAGLFGRKSAFHDYMEHYSAEDSRDAIRALFNVLNTKPEDRDKYLKPELSAFPYVNGGLFDGEDIEIPHFTEEIRSLILEKASDDFNWSEISPTIFGAVFESTLNPETRRKGGMHYTSIENIHKVIDPLFYNDLCKEFEEIKNIKVTKIRNQKLEEFRDKLASLTFLDPACGSGNFLTETYLSLRRLENEAVELLQGGKVAFGFLNPIKVNISQFYGIEINDFAVTVAKTALWIAESQMMQATERIMAQSLEFLPLKTYTNIIEGNALRVDWNDVIPAEKLNYIMGNPPFIGHQWRSKEQVSDMDFVYSDFENYGKLDYVAAWYKKAADLMKDTNIKAAFVSTNSICQGESVAVMWKPLFEKRNLEIFFAYRTFRWDSEASIQAHVHCVIVGFSCSKNSKKAIYDESNKKHSAKNINGYLMDAPNIFIENRGKPLNPSFSKMSKGSQPTDGGNLILTKSEKDELINKHPEASSFIRKFMGAEEFINNKERYCLWLVGISPNEYRKIAPITARLNNVAEIRRKSPTESVKRDADTPMLFTQIRQPSTDYLFIPRVSSIRRKYIPIGYVSPDIIASDAAQFIPNASLFMFGILTSNVHNAWTRVIAGRLKSDFRYSPSVYNNFPWPSVTEKQKEKIEKTAQMILDARAKYPNSSLADLYDDVAMPPELRKAHQANDKAVMEAYGFWGKLNSETECVAELMRMYQELTNE